MKILVTITLAVLLGITSGQAIAFGDSLADIHEDIKAQYEINHVNNKQFSQMNADTLVIFDVRKPEEFKVSHIDSAIRVDPAIKPKDFFAQYGDSLDGKTAVFYCSVGRRSSKLLSEVNDQLTDYGSKNAYNLEGGVFQWHNDQIDLVRNGQNTRDIHPYNLYWSRLINDRSSIEYSVDER